jgi:putative addiction module component (TIGR02574 family)
MGAEAERILAEAMALPPEEREDLATRLFGSIDGEPADPAIEAAWDAEIARRAQQVLSGESKGIPWETVKRDVRSILSRK